MLEDGEGSQSEVPVCLGVVEVEGKTTRKGFWVSCSGCTEGFLEIVGAVGVSAHLLDLGRSPGMARRG